MQETLTLGAALVWVPCLTYLSLAEQVLTLTSDSELQLPPILQHLNLERSL